MLVDFVCAVQLYLNGAVILDDTWQTLKLIPKSFLDWLNKLIHHYLAVQYSDEQ
jgi:hypothetical protein